MRSALVSLALCLVVAGLAASVAGAKLSPAENTWAKSMIGTYNVMSKELDIVISEEEANNALIARTPANATLTKTLEAFALCGTAVKKAGPAPSTRLNPFLTSMNAACLHLGIGANWVAKAIGAIGKGNGTLGKTDLGKSVTEFKTGSNDLAVAAKKLLAIGGKAIFTA